MNCGNVNSRTLEESLFLRLFGNSSILRVISFLLNNEVSDFSKAEIVRGAGISRATLLKIWRILEDFEIVVETRRIGRAKMYKLNKENPIVQKLIELDRAICEYAKKSSSLSLVR